MVASSVRMSKFWVQVQPLGGREGGREGERERERDRGSEREGERERGREGGIEGVRERERERESARERERGREGESEKQRQPNDYEGYRVGGPKFPGLHCRLCFWGKIVGAGSSLGS